MSGIRLGSVYTTFFGHFCFVFFRSLALVFQKSPTRNKEAKRFTPRGHRKSSRTPSETKKFRTKSVWEGGAFRKNCTLGFKWCFAYSCLSPLCPAPVRPGCLFCLFLSLLSPSSQPPIDGVSPNVALKLSSRSRFFWTGWVVWATNTWAVGLARRCRRRFDPRSRSFSLSSTSVFSSLSSTSKFISSHCSFSCLSPLCPAPVRPCCLFCLFLSLLSPSSQPPIDRVSSNVALKLVTKPILLNRLSGLSD